MAGQTPQPTDQPPSITQQQLADAIEAVCDTLGTHDRDVKHAIDMGLRRVFRVEEP
jgi:hypothetical protein